MTPGLYPNYWFLYRVHLLGRCHSPTRQRKGLIQSRAIVASNVPLIIMIVAAPVGTVRAVRARGLKEHVAGPDQEYSRTVRLSR